MLNRARLTGQTAAFDSCEHVELAFGVGDAERLRQDQLLHGARKVFVLRLAVDDDLAGAGLDPNAGDRVFTFAGGIGAAQFVTNRLTRGHFGFGALHAADVLGHGCFETVEGFDFVSHAHALRVFFLFKDLTSRTSGLCASWG